MGYDREKRRPFGIRAWSSMCLKGPCLGNGFTGANDLQAQNACGRRPPFPLTLCVIRMLTPVLIIEVLVSIVPKDCFAEVTVNPDFGQAKVKADTLQPARRASPLADQLCIAS